MISRAKYAAQLRRGKENDNSNRHVRIPCGPAIGGGPLAIVSKSRGAVMARWLFSAYGMVLS